MSFDLRCYVPGVSKLWREASKCSVVVKLGDLKLILSRQARNLGQIKISVLLNSCLGVLVSIKLKYFNVDFFFRCNLHIYYLMVSRQGMFSVFRIYRIIRRVEINKN